MNIARNVIIALFILIAIASAVVIGICLVWILRTNHLALMFPLLAILAAGIKHAVHNELDSFAKEVGHYRCVASSPDNTLVQVSTATLAADGDSVVDLYQFEKNTSFRGIRN